MNPLQSRNNVQRMLDALSVAHGNVMQHCLDADRDEQRSAYNGHSIVREIIGRECIATSVDDNAVRAAVHTVRIPLIEIHRRKRAAMTTQQRINESVAVSSALVELI